MRRSPLPHVGGALAALLAVPPGALRAQRADTSAALAGYVIEARADTVLRPLGGADVTFLDGGRSVRTTADGVFRVDGLAPGTYVVRVRRIGYDPLTVRVVLRPGATTDVDVRLAPLAALLDTARVRADRAERVEGPPAFLARARVGGGHYVTRAQIEALSGVQNAADLAARLLPGVRVDPVTGIVYATRNENITVYGRKCVGLAVVIDGVSMGDDFSVRRIPAEQIAGIEAYYGPSEIPFALRSTENSVCGVLAVWTR